MPYSSGSLSDREKLILYFAKYLEKNRNALFIRHCLSDKGKGKSNNSNFPWSQCLIPQAAFLTEKNSFYILQNILKKIAMPYSSGSLSD